MVSEGGGSRQSRRVSARRVEGVRVRDGNIYTKPLRRGCIIPAPTHSLVGQGSAPMEAS